MLFPLWREALQNPICVVTWRDPIAVARSLATRDDWPPLGSIALWEHYTRTLLRDTEGLPRVLVSYEELIAEPARVTRSLHAALAGFGIDGLLVPSGERIGQVVNPDFDRSGRGARSDETFLDEGQRALLADLKSGSALCGPVAPTPARTLELLAEFAELDALRRRLIDRDQLLDDRDHLLGVIFGSRSWRVGHRIMGLLRLLRRSRALSAEDRWREMKRRRPV